MNKTAEYIQFEEGFFKEAAAHDCDIAFLRGYVKQADEIVEIWKQAFDELAEKSGDPQYKIKMANELVYLSMVSPNLTKQAEGGFESFLGGLGKSVPMLGDAQNWISKGGLGQTIGDLFKKNPNMLSSLIAGGGGGGLIGLLIGALTGHPMLGLTLGGLGGAGLSAYFGNKGIQDSVSGLFGEKKPTPVPQKEGPGQTTNGQPNYGEGAIPESLARPDHTGPTIPMTSQMIDHSQYQAINNNNFVDEISHTQGGLPNPAMDKFKASIPINAGITNSPPSSYTNATNITPIPTNTFRNK